MVRSAVMRDLMTTLSATAALATVALIVVATTPSKQTTVLDFAPWKAPPWDSRAGQGQSGGDWYDQPGDFVGADQHKAPTQILFDPYAKPWDHEPMSSKSIAKEKTLYAFDKYAPLYGYGAQHRAPVQQLYQASSDPYRMDGERSEAKRETTLYYQQKLNDFYHEKTNVPLAIQGRQQMLAEPWNADETDRKLALAEKHQYYQNYFRRYYAGEDALTRSTA